MEEPIRAETRTWDEMRTWTRWDVARPVASGTYWWRVPAGVYAGVELRPEWRADVHMAGMGFGPNELWPTFSRWDGYNRTVYANLEWRTVEADDLQQKVVWRGLDVATCPFCGTQPVLDSVQGAYGGGVVVTWDPLRHNTFWLSCASCGMARSPHVTDLAALVRAWNRRVGLPVRGVAPESAESAAAGGLAGWETSRDPRHSTARVAFVHVESGCRAISWDSVFRPAVAYRPLETGEAFCDGNSISNPPTLSEAMKAAEVWWDKHKPQGDSDA